MSLPAFENLPLSPALIADLKSDHAGECGAVAIYRGVLAVSGNPELRRFARSHLRAELRHRRFFDRWLPRRHRSRLLPLWRAAGWALGALPALFGPRWVYRTVDAVESFVERHYLSQLDAMRGQPALAELAAQLRRFCDDEVEHRDEARDRLAEPAGWGAKIWARIVGAGSSFGVRVARRI